MKVGDLVRMRNDPDTWGGHGVVIGINGMREVLVRWFDSWAEAPVEWCRPHTVEVLSESV